MNASRADDAEISSDLLAHIDVSALRDEDISRLREAAIGWKSLFENSKGVKAVFEIHETVADWGSVLPAEEAEETSMRSVRIWSAAAGVRCDVEIAGDEGRSTVSNREYVFGLGTPEKRGKRRTISMLRQRGMEGVSEDIAVENRGDAMIGVFASCWMYGDRVDNWLNGLQVTSLENVPGETSNGFLLRVHFGGRHPVWGKLGDSSLLCDPTNDYRLVSREVRFADHNYSETAKLTYDQGLPAFSPSVVEIVSSYDDGFTTETEYRMKSVEAADLSDSSFRLSSFGYPEPTFDNRPAAYRRGMWFVALSLVLGVSYLRLRDRG